MLGDRKCVRWGPREEQTTAGVATMKDGYGRVLARTLVATRAKERCVFSGSRIGVLCCTSLVSMATGRPSLFQIASKCTGKEAGLLHQEKAP